MELGPNYGEWRVKDNFNMKDQALQGIKISWSKDALALKTAPLFKTFDKAVIPFNIKTIVFYF